MVSTKTYYVVYRDADEGRREYYRDLTRGWYWLPGRATRLPTVRDAREVIVALDRQGVEAHALKVTLTTTEVEV